MRCHAVFDKVTNVIYTGCHPIFHLTVGITTIRASLMY
jgi:hypothetical protein